MIDLSTIDPVILYLYTIVLFGFIILGTLKLLIWWSEQPDITPGKKTK